MALQLLPFSWLDFSMNFDEWKGRNYRIALILGGKAKPTFVKMIRLRIMDAKQDVWKIIMRKC